ncbi:MAG: tRNA epoxyqueuosine(34) reductase QueG [Chitinophagales bacterium]
MINKHANYSFIIKQKAKELGFEDIGISKAEFLEKEAPRLENWLNQNYHGEMAYMANHFDKRLDPTKLVEGSKSVISFSYNYFTEQKQAADSYKISKYAYGRDYHKVIKKKLIKLLAFIQTEIGEVSGRAFVDSAPVMERAWAKKSGIAWQGKNTLMLTKGKGSFHFLAELIIDLELEPDNAVKDYCGNCTKCIDACPTNAITPYQVDGSKCISYLTIELKDQIPNEFNGKFEDWMFGCDICQDVCPINARAKQHKEQDFLPKKETLSMTKTEWQEITEDVFNNLFNGTPVRRTKYAGLKRNIGFFR